MNNSESELMDKLPISDVLGKEIARGGNSICYENKIDPNQIVLEIGSARGEADKKTLERMKDRLQQEINLYNQIPNGINAPRITGTKIENDKLYKFMEKSPGMPIQDRNSSFEKWQESLLMLANVPEDHYLKLVNDITILSKIGLQVDPSKSDNIYYDKKTGFHLIDLNTGGYDASSDLVIPLVYTFNLFTRFKNKIDQEIKDNIRTIRDKLMKVGSKPREYSLNQINEIIEN